MSLRGLYISGDVVGSPGGAGAVTRNELKALQDLPCKVRVLDGINNVIPAYAHLDLPFLWDYQALSSLEPELRNLDYGVKDPPRPQLAHIYSGCYSETVRALKRAGVRVTYTSPAHNRELSIEEAKICGLPPPWPHVTDEALWKQHNQGLREADMVVAPSSASAEYLSSLGVKNLCVIPHGTEIPETVAPFQEE